MPFTQWNQDVALGVVMGFVATTLFIGIGYAIALRQRGLYDVQHWKLNLRLPLDSMWMNMGYWKSQDEKSVNHLNEACHALLRQVLQAGKLIEPSEDSTQATGRGAISILDVGIGCGDQTLALAKLLHHEHLSYVGLTLSPLQFRYVQATVSQRLDSDATYTSPLSIFCADAAKPQSWTPDVQNAVQKLLVEGEKSSSRQQWLLALDCLYHFRPSRRPLLDHAARKLNANLMAFDLLLDDQANWVDKLRAKLLGIAMGCPTGAFLTIEQYRQLLVECGYDGKKIVMADISEHVFSGLAEFLSQQQGMLGQYGIGIGGFGLMQRLFKWIARSRVIRGVIVVART